MMCKIVSEFENKLEDHIKNLELKIKEIELKYNLIETKTKQMSEIFEKKWVESDSRMKTIIESTMKIQKVIEEINSQIKIVNQRVEKPRIIHF